MATSGTYSFNLDIDEVIREALEMVGGEVTLGNDIPSAKRSLNLMLTDWQNKGISLWTVDTTAVSVAVSTTAVALTSSTVDVLGAVWQVSSNAEYAMERISMEEYLDITDKSKTGRPSQFAIRRGRDYPTVYLYPVPNNSTGNFKCEQFRKIQDVSRTALENADVPTRFLPSLTAGLAYYMSLKRPNTPESRIAILKQNYGELLTNAMEEDRERTSLFFRPKISRI